MKIAVIGDIHFNYFKDFGFLDDDGENFRFKNIQRAFGLICDYCLKNDINDLFIAGDIFHTRAYLKTSLVNKVKSIFKYYCKNGLRFYALSGNHDLEDYEGDEFSSAINLLDEYLNLSVRGEVFDVCKIENAVIGMFGYFAKDEDYIGMLESSIENYDFNVIISHIGISEVLPEVTKGCISINDLDSMLKKGICFFNGHFHKGQHIIGNNVVQLGSICQNSFGEQNYNSYMVIYDAKDCVIDDVVNLNSEVYMGNVYRFKECNGFNELKENFEFNKFYRVFVSDTKEAKKVIKFFKDREIDDKFFKIKIQKEFKKSFEKTIKLKSVRDMFIDYLDIDDECKSIKEDLIDEFDKIEKEVIGG